MKLTGNYKHGHSRGPNLPEYRAWKRLRNRCRNPNNKDFKYYGAQGVTVADRWNDFPLFLADMGKRPTPTHSIDRYPNPFGNYEPGNCRWATPGEQSGNRRTNRYITFNGKTQTIAAWARDLGITKERLWHRLTTLGWTIERALH